MINVHVILPHLKKFGGVRRYLEFGNSLIKLNTNINYTIWLIDYTDKYEWIKELKFQGNIDNITNIPNIKNKEGKHIIICGDAGSLKYLDIFNFCDQKIINIIFPLNSGYALGDYGSFVNINDGKTFIIGNSTGWDINIPPQSNYMTIPGAVNLDMFQPKERRAEDDVFKVLFMGKKRPWKRFDKFIDLIKKCKNISFSYFDTEKHIELDQLGATAYINIPQSEMADLYSQHDCFISMEQLAGWQNTVAEAMACKCPVITTKSGTSDIAFHNKTALVIQTEDKIVEEMMTYLYLMRNNKQLRNALSEAAYHHIQQFSWDNYAQKYLNIFTPESRATFSTENILTDEQKAIQEKANELKKYLNTIYNPQKSLLFDKYEKYGAYHWNSEHDKPYHIYINQLKKCFHALVEFYGDEYNLIDIGGGDGFISHNIQQYVKSIDIIELNKKAVELAKDKLKDNKKINIYNQDLFKTDLSKYDIILLSQVIEHFEHPEEIIKYLKKFNNKIIIMSTPLAKKDGTMWDQNYHAQEFFPEDLVELVKPLHDDYIVSLFIIEPHNQIMILENKYNAVYNYTEMLFFNPDFKPEETMKKDIVASYISMLNSKPRLNYINPEDEK